MNMISKTIGGDRLGSGNKMKQSMHNYERSNHDIGYMWRSTMACGTLVPFLKQVMLPGDTFDIKLNTKTLTHPTIGPMLGSYKLQLDVFSIPIRLYQAQLHNNKVDIGNDMSKIRLPRVSFEANNIDFNSPEPVDIQQVNPSSLMKYLGTSGFGSRMEGNEPKSIKTGHNALPYLMYYDIVKNYFTNKQEKVAMIIDYTDVGNTTIGMAQVEWINAEGAWTSITLPATEPIYPLANGGITIYGTNLDPDIIEVQITGDEGEIWIPLNTAGATLWNEPDKLMTMLYDKMGEVMYRQGIYAVRVRPNAIKVPTPQITEFPIKNFDDMREDILAAIKDPSSFTITDETYAPYGNNFKKINEGEIGSKIRSYLPMQGLALKTYQSDLFNNWLNDEWITGENGIAQVTAVAIQDDLLILDTLNLQQKVYNMLSRIALSGGTYYDWIEVVYGQKSLNMAETPVYQGGLSKEIVFNEIISNAATGEEPLGTLAGKGVQTDKHKGGFISIKTDEPAYVMGIVSITPRLDYSQGNDWDMDLVTMDDFHKPELDGIGYQDLLTAQMAAWDNKAGINGNITQYAAGKLPAWMNYMTNVNKCYGNFADENNEMFMTLNRRYEPDPETGRIKDLTTYIDPIKFNYVFAHKERSAQNFWVQIDVDIEARRKVSARQIPNL